MGLFDFFKKRRESIVKENDITNKGESLSTSQSDLVVQEDLVSIQTENKYSSIIPDETIEKIMQINNISFIEKLLIKRLEEHPQLVDLLLSGNVPENIVFQLNYDEKLLSLPYSINELQYIEYFEVDEKIKKHIDMLKNRVSIDSINSNYQGCYIDFSMEFEVKNFKNEINSFFSNINIALDTEKLIEMPIVSSTIIYYPKSKNKIVSHFFNTYISDSVELDEDTIIQMPYNTFCYLDESIVEKISRCQLVFSDGSDFVNDDIFDESNSTSFDSSSVIPDFSFENPFVDNYKLLKFNHLLYVIEESSLSSEIKEKLLYKIKNLFFNGGHNYSFEISDIISFYLGEISLDEINEITKRFESNIEQYRNKPITKPEFNPDYYIEQYLPDLENTNISIVINRINYLPEEHKLMVLRRPGILAKFNMSDEISDDKLKRFASLLLTRLPSTTMDFVKSLDFDFESFMSNPDNDYLSSFNINPIVSQYGVFDPIYEETTISVADLVGHDSIDSPRHMNKRKNILYTFNSFFEKYGDGYHTRSLDLLKYKSGEEFVKALENRNRDTVDMHVKYVDDGKYIISSNGLHRFTVLRFHYLLDHMEMKKSEEELREIYKIPVTLSHTTNFKKSYCNYLLKLASPDISFIAFDTKEDIITIYYKNEEQRETINEEMLLNLAIQSINSFDYESLSEIYNYYNSIESFHTFVDTYIPDLINRFEEVSEEAR